MVELKEQLQAIEAEVVEQASINDEKEVLAIETIKLTQIDCGDEVSKGIITIDTARAMLSTLMTEVKFFT